MGQVELTHTWPSWIKVSSTWPNTWTQLWPAWPIGNLRTQPKSVDLLSFVTFENVRSYDIVIILYDENI